MALPLRPHAVPQCSACIRSYVFAGLWDVAAPTTALRQQFRGKKRLPNNSGTLIVRLLQDVKAYGRKGAIVPISRGAMRNSWFPEGVAEYVTAPELKTLRIKNVPMDRGFYFDGAQQTTPTSADVFSNPKSMSDAELRDASAFLKPLPSEMKKLTPERSVELVKIFVPPRMDFYRQPIAEEKKPELETPVDEKKRPQFGGAAGDLLAARMRQSEKAKEEPSGPRAIYGSVSTNDVLVALRAAMANNDEAARVVLHEDDVKFVDLPVMEGLEAERVKYIGDFIVEIRVRGAEQPIRRVVKIVPQEA